MNKISLWKYAGNYIFIVFGEVTTLPYTSGKSYKFYGIPIIYNNDRVGDTSIARFQSWSLPDMVKIYE